MDNPYKSPTAINSVPPRLSQSRFWWWRFTLLLFAMFALNFARLFLTWREFGGDGYEQIGFPFVAFERGGFSYSANTYYHLIAVNLLIAWAVAYYGAHLLRDRWYAALRKIQA